MVLREREQENIPFLLNIKVEHNRTFCKYKEVLFTLLPNIIELA